MSRRKPATMPIRVHDLVWFDWKGFRNVSPVLAVNRTTVRVAVSEGEKLLPKSRVIDHEPTQALAGTGAEDE